MNPKMRTRRGVLVALAVLALLSVVALAAASTGSAAPPAGTVRDGPSLVVPGSLSGGNYQFTTSNWVVTGYSTGGPYQLGRQPQVGEGCCCKGYLPCITR